MRLAFGSRCAHTSPFFQSLLARGGMTTTTVALALLGSVFVAMHGVVVYRQLLPASTKLSSTASTASLMNEFGQCPPEIVELTDSEYMDGVWSVQGRVSDDEALEECQVQLSGSCTDLLEVNSDGTFATSISVPATETWNVNFRARDVDGLQSAVVTHSYGN